MTMFYRELFRTLVNPQKDDKFMEMKINKAKKKLKIIAGQERLKRKTITKFD